MGNNKSRKNKRTAQKPSTKVNSSQKLLRFWENKVRPEISLMRIITSIASLITLYLFVELKCINEDDTTIEKRSAIQILDRAKDEVELKRQWLAAKFNTFTDSSKMDSSYAKMFMMNPLTLPEIMYDLLKKEIVLKYANSEIIESIQATKKNINMVVKAVNTAYTSDKYKNSNYHIRQYIDNYGKELWFIREVLKISIEHISGRIDYEAFDNRKQNLIAQKVGMTREELMRFLNDTTNILPPDY